MRFGVSTVLSFLLAVSAAVNAQTIRYLDCGLGSDNSDALSPATAWRSVAKANSFTLNPGDSLLIARGSRCEGMLWPKGSGRDGAPIHLGAYGSGALPVIVGGSESEGLKLSDQQYWEIENLEVVGGTPYGIRITGTLPVLRHFRISNVVVHDVSGDPSTKDSGLVVIGPASKSSSRISDVVIDGVTAYRTTQWAGIVVNGAESDIDDASIRGDNVTIRNSIVRDVGGDGILLARVQHGLLEHNAAWNTGMQYTETIGTPNAIWEWMCSDCLVQYNEGFFSDSPGVDGGVFDIDYGNVDNRVEHNFGHDSAGYCVSVFGAESKNGDSVNSVVRNNICINNGRSPRLAKRQGAIFLYTWRGGKLDGVRIENNTVLWNPPLDAPAIHNEALFTGERANIISGNTIESSTSSVVSSIPGMKYENNRYIVSRMSEPSWSFDGKQYSDLEAVRRGAHQEAGSTVSQRSRCSFAAQTSGDMYASAGKANDAERNWTLLASLVPEGSENERQSRSQMVVIQSMTYQFSKLGLHAVVIPAVPADSAVPANWIYDWDFGSAVHLEQLSSNSPAKAYQIDKTPQVLLISPSGKVVKRWKVPAAPAEIWMALRSYLGTPPGMQAIPSCQMEGDSGAGFHD
jgi:hypothetical protein